MSDTAIAVPTKETKLLLPLVYVKPLPREKWHGKKNKESFGQPKSVEVLYNPNTGQYDTGLTDEETERYSRELGLDLSKTFNPESSHPYWGSRRARILLPNSTFTINPNEPFGYIKLKNCEASPLVANSMEEYNKGMWPKATHVIFNEGANMEEKATEIEIKETVIVKLAGMSTDAKVTFIQVIRNKDFSKQSPNYVRVEMQSIIDDPKDLKTLVKLLAKSKEDVKLEALVRQAILKGILTQEGDIVKFMSTVIGAGIEDAVDNLKKSENQNMLLSLMAKIENKGK